MTTPTKPPTWFWIAAIVGLLWNLIGIMTFIMHITMSEETLNAMPENERQLYTDFPIWVTITYFIAVFDSTIGNILLLMRKSIATMVLGIGFAAIVVQMVYTLFISKAIEVHGPSAMGLPIMIIVIGGLLLWLSSTAQKRGWIS